MGVEVGVGGESRDQERSKHIHMNTGTSSSLLNVQDLLFSNVKHIDYRIKQINI